MTGLNKHDKRRLQRDKKRHEKEKAAVVKQQEVEGDEEERSTRVGEATGAREAGMSECIQSVSIPNMQMQQELEDEKRVLVSFMTDIDTYFIGTLHWPPAHRPPHPLPTSITSSILGVIGAILCGLP